MISLHLVFIFCKGKPAKIPGKRNAFRQGEQCCQCHPSAAEFGSSGFQEQPRLTTVLQHPLRIHGDRVSIPYRTIPT